MLSKLNRNGKTVSNEIKNGESNQIGNIKLNRVINDDKCKTTDANDGACVR